MWFNSKQREEPYLNLTSRRPGLNRLFSSLLELRRQVVHGCRQLVSWDVGLSPATSATPIFSSHHSVGHSRETARDNLEEGGDDVKSSCPLCLGLHTCYNGCYKGKRCRKVQQTPKKQSQFGLWSATRPHEVGIASNRESECRGEYVPGSCTHRPSHHGSWGGPTPVTQPEREGAV